MPVDERYRWLEGQGHDAFLLYAVQANLEGRNTGVGKLGVAVSGGGDSMALLHLVVRVAKEVGWHIRAVTVDHRLRPEAADEAAFVAGVCKGLGVPHDVLVWDHDSVSGNVMQAAREARYRLISEWARGHGIATVALAHTADDQAETFLIELSRAAGLEGLSGMRQRFVQDCVTFNRPLLGEPRDGLRAYLRGHGLSWVDDPTNVDARYTRSKARRVLQALRPLGITVDRLSTVIHNLKMARGVVSEVVWRAGNELVTTAGGALFFDRRQFLDLGPEVDRLMLQAMLVWMSGRPYPPRAYQLHNLYLAIVRGTDATLAGCRFLQRNGRVTVTREPRAVEGPVPMGQVWDRRWVVEGPTTAGEVRALGAEGLRQCPEWRATGLPREVLVVTPGVWRDGVLVAAPLAGWENGWSARLDAPREVFGLSD